MVFWVGIIIIMALRAFACAVRMIALAIATFTTIILSILPAMLFIGGVLAIATARLVALASALRRWCTQRCLAFCSFLSVTFARQVVSVIALAAVLSSMAMATASLTELSVARLVIALIKVSVRVPACSSLVILPGTHRRTIFSLRLRLALVTAAIGKVRFALASFATSVVHPAATFLGLVKDAPLVIALMFILRVAIGFTATLRFVEQLFHAPSFTQLSEETLVSTFNSFPLHLLKPVFQHVLSFYLTLESSFDDVGLDALACVLSFGALVNKFLRER